MHQMIIITGRQQVTVIAGTMIGMVDKVFESITVSVGIALYIKIKKDELHYKMWYLVYYMLFWPTVRIRILNTQRLETLMSQASSECRNYTTSY